MTVLENVVEASDWLAGKRRFGEQVAILRHGLRLFPDAPCLLLRLANTLTLASPTEARAAAQRAIDLGIDDDPNLLTRAAYVFYETGDSENAATLVRRAAARGEDGFRLGIDLRYLTGLLLVDKGFDEPAEEMFDVAYELSPHSKGFAESYIGVLRRRGKVAKAREVVEDAIRHRPDDEALSRLREQIESD